MTFYPLLSKTGKVFHRWPFGLAVKVGVLKLLAKVNVWVRTPLLAEDGHYTEIENEGYVVQSHQLGVCVKKKVWQLKGIILRRYTTDFHAFRQIFFHNELNELINFIGTESISTILDAGANVGMTALKLETVYPGAKMYCIEPDANNFRTLEANITYNSLNAIAVQTAVWSKSAKLYFDHTFRDGREWSITVTENNTGSHSIEAVSINDLVRIFNLRQIDLLKMDIEGSEKEIFEAGEDALSFLAITKFIAVEVHEEVVKTEYIGSQLSSRGFDLSKSGEYLIGRNRNLGLQ